MSLAPTHHPAEETLLRHAAGTLAPGRALVVATHLPFCRDCRAAIRLGEAIGGTLLADEPGAELASDALSAYLGATGSAGQPSAQSSGRSSGWFTRDGGRPREPGRRCAVAGRVARPCAANMALARARNSAASR